MKPHQPFVGTIVLPIRRPLPGLAALALLGLAGSLVTAAEPQQPYALYMGVDLSVEQAGRLHRVEGVSGSSLVVQIDGKRQEIPTRRKSLSLKIDRALKLSRSVVTILELQGERAYTPANDPRRKFMRNAGGMGADATARLAEQGVVNAYQVLANAKSSPISGGVASAEQNLNRSFNAFHEASSAAASDLNNAASQAMKLEEELARELYDAMSVSFVVSSAQRIEDPSAIVLMRFREKAGKPGSSREWIFASSIDPIGPTPQRVRIVHGGFPPGFEVETFEVHLFNRGRELATDVSPRKIGLSSADAFEYLFIDYLAEHPGATVVPSLALGEIPQDFAARVGAERLTQTFFVRVSAQGRPLEIFLDESCSEPSTEESVRDVLQRVYFKPALRNGEPVEGVAKLQLKDLVHLQW